MFRTKTRVYIVMHYMPNGTIGNRVRREGPLGEWNVKCWFPPIVRAVKYLHDNRIAHRDLKLDNILLDTYQNPMVSDFGFSRFLDYDPTRTTTTPPGGSLSHTYCGTRSHNPPEILRKQAYDPYRGDVWCLGVMLFIMFNQIYPFDRTEPRDVMYLKQMARDYRLQPRVERQISREAKSLIVCLLEPEPAKRPAVAEICLHPWFPVVHQEAEWFRAQAIATAASESGYSVTANQIKSSK